MARPREPRRIFEHLEESLLTDCDCYGCRNERVGIRKAFEALRDRMELVLDVTVDKDSILFLEDEGGACEVRLLFKPGEHITIYTDKKPGGWVIGPRKEWAVQSNKPDIGFPYIGQRVIIDCLLKGRGFLGTIVHIHPLEETYRGRPLCTVKLDSQKALVYNTVYYTEEPGEVRGTLWQICYPAPKEEQTLGDIANNLIRAIGLDPEEVYEQFVALISSQKKED